MKKTTTLAGLIATAGLWAWGAAPLAAQTRPAGTQPCADRPVAITLRNVRWQLLPPEVRLVFVGPDQRVWHVLGDGVVRPPSHPPSQPHLAAIKARIEAEFARPSPQIWAARPVLFEKSGRVWFLASGMMTLLAYDGKTWIERSADPGKPFLANCPGHGRVEHYPAVQAFEGRLFFGHCGGAMSESGGVHIFDGKDWTCRSFAPPPAWKVPAPAWTQTVRYPRYFGQMQFVIEPDGKGLVVMGTGAPAAMWRYRDGRWTYIPLPTQFVRTCVSAMGLGADGTAYLSSGAGRLVLVRLADSAAVWEERFGAPLKQLGAEQFEAREKASQELSILGPWVWPLMTAAIERTTDPEVKWRLEVPIKKVEAELERLLGVDPDPPAIGPYTVRSPSGFHRDESGRLWVSAYGLSRDSPPFWGTLIIDPKGDLKVLTRAEFPLIGNGNNQFSVEAGRKTWFVPRTTDGVPTLVDMRTLRVLAKPMEPGFRWIHAVTADGAVFVSAADDRGNPQPPVALYRPDAPDDRPAKGR